MQPEAVRRRGLLPQPRWLQPGGAARRPDRRAPCCRRSTGGDRTIEMMLWEMAQLQHLEQSAVVAGLIEQTLRARVQMSPRAIQQAPFRVLVGANMPAVLVELGFISNPEEEKLLGVARLPAAARRRARRRDRPLSRPARRAAPRRRAGRAAATAPDAPALAAAGAEDALTVRRALVAARRDPRRRRARLGVFVVAARHRRAAAARRAPAPPSPMRRPSGGRTIRRRCSMRTRPATAWSASSARCRRPTTPPSRPATSSIASSSRRRRRCCRSIPEATTLRDRVPDRRAARRTST